MTSPAEQPPLPLDPTSAERPDQEAERLLRLCLRYLEHPDVVAINFALPSTVAAARVRRALDEAARR